jgi:hypothetical protein
VSTPQVRPPADGALGSTLSQILIKQGEMGVQLAVISEQLKVMPDHEQRLRALERFRFTLLGTVIAASAATSALGTWIGYSFHH